MWTALQAMSGCESGCLWYPSHSNPVSFERASSCHGEPQGDEHLKLMRSTPVA